MIFHAEGRTYVSDHALELILPILMPPRACGVHDASVWRPCTPHARTPQAQDGRQVHTCRAESALDGHSGFAHAVIMSVQTQCCGQCGMRAPLHGCTALPPGSVHAAKGKICSSVKISRRENISFLPDPSSWHLLFFTLRTLQTPFVKNKNDDKEWNAHPERCGRERNLKRHARQWRRH